MNEAVCVVFQRELIILSKVMMESFFFSTAEPHCTAARGLCSLLL